MNLPLLLPILAAPLVLSPGLASLVPKEKFERAHALTIGAGTMVLFGPPNAEPIPNPTATDLPPTALAGTPHALAIVAPARGQHTPTSQADPSRRVPTADTCSVDVMRVPLGRSRFSPAVPSVQLAPQMCPITGLAVPRQVVTALNAAAPPVPAIEVTVSDVPLDRPLPWPPVLAVPPAPQISIAIPRQVLNTTSPAPAHEGPCLAVLSAIPIGQQRCQESTPAFSLGGITALCAAILGMSTVVLLTSRKQRSRSLAVLAADGVSENINQADSPPASAVFEACLRNVDCTLVPPTSTFVIALPRSSTSTCLSSALSLDDEPLTWDHSSPAYAVLPPCTDPTTSTTDSPSPREFSPEGLAPQALEPEQPDVDKFTGSLAHIATTTTAPPCTADFAPSHFAQTSAQEPLPSPQEAATAPTAPQSEEHANSDVRSLASSAIPKFKSSTESHSATDVRSTAGVQLCSTNDEGAVKGDQPGLSATKKGEEEEEEWEESGPRAPQQGRKRVRRRKRRGVIRLAKLAALAREKEEGDDDDDMEKERDKEGAVKERMAEPSLIPTPPATQPHQPVQEKEDRGLGSSKWAPMPLKEEMEKEEKKEEKKGKEEDDEGMEEMVSPRVPTALPPTKSHRDSTADEGRWLTLPRLASTAGEMKKEEGQGLCASIWASAPEEVEEKGEGRGKWHAKKQRRRKQRWPYTSARNDSRTLQAAKREQREADEQEATQATTSIGKARVLTVVEVPQRILYYPGQPSVAPAWSPKWKDRKWQRKAI